MIEDKKIKHNEYLFVNNQKRVYLWNIHKKIQSFNLNRGLVLIKICVSWLVLLIE